MQIEGAAREQQNVGIALGIHPLHAEHLAVPVLGSLGVGGGEIDVVDRMGQVVHGLFSCLSSVAGLTWRQQRRRVACWIRSSAFPDRRKQPAPFARTPIATPDS